MPDDDLFLVAHGVRIKGFASPSFVAAITGLDETRVVAHLTTLRDAGHAAFREGRVTGWSLTTEGRHHHADACTAWLEASGVAREVEDAYRRFLELNVPFLTVCTSWQLRDGTDTLNDHTDTAYDESVVARLDDLHAQVLDVLGELAAVVPRFGGYSERLWHAWRQIESGEREWFTGAMIESYHTVWFEFHEDLLATLGIERSKEN